MLKFDNGILMYGLCISIRYRITYNLKITMLLCKYSNSEHLLYVSQYKRFN